MNDNSSSIYYSFLNTSKGVTYLEQAFVPKFVTTPPNLDLFYLLNGLNRIIDRYFWEAGGYYYGIIFLFV